MFLPVAFANTSPALLLKWSFVLKFSWLPLTVPAKLNLSGSEKLGGNEEGGKKSDTSFFEL